MAKLRTRSSQERELLVWAKARGWKPVGRNGANHMVLRYERTGAFVRVPGKIVGPHIGAAAKSQIKKAEGEHG